MNSIYILILLFFFSCSLFNNDQGKEPIEQYFRTEVNGETWSGEPFASLQKIDGLDWVTILAYQKNPDFFPYRTKIGFTGPQQKENLDYDILWRLEPNEYFAGGSFLEMDGDVTIAWYEPIEDSDNLLKIDTSIDKEGNIIASGSFSYTAVAREVFRDERYLPYRLYPDTIRIRNGEFKILVTVK